MPTTRGVPLSLHEDLIERQYARDPETKAVVEDPALRALAGAVKTARLAVEQVAELHRAVGADKTITPEAAALTVRSAAVKLGEKAAKVLDDARAAALAEMQRVEAETAAPPPGDPAIESEVRSMLARATHEQRSKIVADAIKAGDDTTCGAVLRAGVPAWLSGLGQAELDMRREQWRRARHPGVSDRLDRMRKAIEATDRGGRLLVTFVQDAANSPAAQLAEAAAARAAHAIEAAKVAAE